MSVYSKELLSESVKGEAVQVSATSIGSGDTVHTAPASVIDLVTLFAFNDDAGQVVLTLDWNGTPWVGTIEPGSGLTLIIADLPLADGADILAAADTTDVIYLYGYVNRIT